MNILARCVAVASLLGVTAWAQTPAPAGFAPLFDGKSLNNWVVDDKRYAGNFSVRDGHLHIEGQGGWLRSNREYGDFTLRLGFRYLTEDPGGGRIGIQRDGIGRSGTIGRDAQVINVFLAVERGGVGHVRPAIVGYYGDAQP